MTTDLKHTPGPWMAAAAPSSVVGWPIVGPMGRSIANVSWMPKPPHVSDMQYEVFGAECAANARLIAAAPELLEALQSLLFAMGGGSKEEWPEVIAARAAIAKAGA